jgi:hypothetical protein
MMNMTQRLPRYELLLRELEKLSNKMLVTQATGAEPSAEKELQEAVKAALENLRERTASMNSGVGDAERRQRAMQVARDVLKLEDLVAPNRKLLKEGQLTKLRRDKLSAPCHRSERRAFLFSDLLVLHVEGKRSRVLELHAVILITRRSVHSPVSNTQETVGFDASDRFRKALTAFDVDPTMLSAEDSAAAFVLAVAGSGNQILLRAASESDRDEWVEMIIRAAESCRQGRAGETAHAAEREESSLVQAAPSNQFLAKVPVVAIADVMTVQSHESAESSPDRPIK